MAELGDVYDSEAEMRQLFEILGPRYVAMILAVHNSLQRILPNVNILQFRITDADVAYMLTQAAEQVTNIDQTTRQAIRGQLVVGQSNGLSTWEIANGNDQLGYRGIQGLYMETWKGRSEMIARTELQHAQNEASLNRYARAGVEMVQIIDGDDWDLPCSERNGRVVPITDRPQLNHPNCLVSGQVVWAANRQAGTARWYDGEIIVLRTTADDLLTVTPNHPILTDHGWVAAGQLIQGQRVIRSPHPERTLAAIDPHHQHRPSLIEQIAHTVWPASQRAAATVPLTAEAFHGDASPGDVCVVWTDRRAQLRARQMLREPPVVVTHAQRAQLTGRRSSLETFDRVDTTATADVSRTRIGRTLSSSPAPFAKTSRLSHRSGEARIPDPSRDGTWINADQLGDLANAQLLVDVELAEVGRLPFQGHVYNLQTEQGWYIAEHIVTHNCTMTVVPVTQGII